MVSHRNFCEECGIRTLAIPRSGKKSICEVCHSEIDTAPKFGSGAHRRIVNNLQWVHDRHMPGFLSRNRSVRDPAERLRRLREHESVVTGGGRGVFMNIDAIYAEIVPPLYDGVDPSTWLNAAHREIDEWGVRQVALLPADPARHEAVQNIRVAVRGMRDMAVNDASNA